MQNNIPFDDMFKIKFDSINSTNKTNIVEKVIMLGFKDFKKKQNDEITLLNHLKNYLLKHHIDCYFKSIFQLTEDATGKESNSYSHWVLYLRDFKLYIDLDGIYEHDTYIEKVANKYGHDKDLVGYISTEPIWDDELEITYQNDDLTKFSPIKQKNNKYESLNKWFEFCNLNNLMLEDEDFKKNLNTCSIEDLEECPF